MLLLLYNLLQRALQTPTHAMSGVNMCTNTHAFEMTQTHKSVSGKKVYLSLWGFLFTLKNKTFLSSFCCQRPPYPPLLPISALLFSFFYSSYFLFLALQKPQVLLRCRSCAASA